MTSPTKQYQFHSPAKLNLFLHIVGQRDDGYHELESVFQFLEHGDTISIEVTSSTSINLTTPIIGVPNESNLIYKAAKLLQSKYNVKQGANISIAKVLPMGGGLGGGSSNAATVLMALNSLWQLKLPKQVLMDLGLTLGADVPIFIHGHAAFAQGVGEKLTNIEPEESWYLVTKPEVSISTKDVFCAPSLIRDTPKLNPDQIVIKNCHNDCQTYVIKHYPEVAKLLAWLVEYAPSQMTGTGACIFSRFNNRVEAAQIQEKLPSGVESFIAKGINCSPLLADIAALK